MYIEWHRVVPFPCFPSMNPQYPRVQQEIGKGSVTNRAVNKQKPSNNAIYATFHSKYRRHLYTAVANLRELPTASFGFHVAKTV